MGSWLSFATTNSPEDYAGYDFPDAKERMRYTTHLDSQKLFTQFQYEYIDFFNSRKKDNKEEFEYEIGKFHEIRQNISVLIIVGSIFHISKDPFYNGYYQKDAEDLSTALLIRHIFHYAFGIPYSQILVTSTQNSEFVNLDCEVDLISAPTRFYEEISDKKPNFEYYFKPQEKSEFNFHQDVNIAQVGTRQFKFYFPEPYDNVVQPFNIEIIKNHQNFSNENTHLFVFFLNHGYVGQFGGIPYQFFIERLLKIDCKHFYVCNDSCNSGSMINLIKICKEFRQIFPYEDDLEVESVLFSFLVGLDKVEIENMQKEVDKKLKTFDFGNIKIESIRIVKSKLENMNELKITKVSQFVNNVNDRFSKEKCVPHHFLKFAEKAIIFASSSYDQSSISLPGREFNISILQHPRTRVFGNIFSSIFIESLLDKNSQTSLKEFSKNIENLFHKYREDFEKYINAQNVPIQGKMINESLFTPKEVDDFFNYKMEERTYFFNKSCDWPNLKNIFLDEKFWDVDISKVNEEEYINVHFCVFKKASSADHQVDNPNNYGPIKGEYYCNKFKKDFEKAVNSFLEKCEPKESFSAFISTEIPPIVKCNGFARFIGEIKPINPNFSRVIESLRNPIINFFLINPNNVDRDSAFFVKAFKDIEPFWVEY